jgi:hypothetical protein
VLGLGRGALDGLQHRRRRRLGLGVGGGGAVGARALGVDARQQLGELGDRAAVLLTVGAQPLHPLVQLVARLLGGGLVGQRPLHLLQQRLLGGRRVGRRGGRRAQRLDLLAQRRDLGAGRVALAGDGVALGLGGGARVVGLVALGAGDLLAALELGDPLGLVLELGRAQLELLLARAELLVGGERLLDHEAEHRVVDARLVEHLVPGPEDRLDLLGRGPALVGVEVLRLGGEAVEAGEAPGRVDDLQPVQRVARRGPPVGVALDRWSLVEAQPELFQGLLGGAPRVVLLAQLRGRRLGALLRPRRTGRLLLRHAPQATGYNCGHGLRRR